MNKILIIKLGYSETLDPEISNRPSLGDVLRTTVLLHAFKRDHVTWLVDEKAYPLLEGNEFINRILIFDLVSVLQLRAEKFDTVINFEKVPGICALTSEIKAWRYFGFRFDDEKGRALAYDKAERVLSLCLNPDKKKKNTTYWQQALMEMIGKKWKGEEYVLGYKPQSRIKYDIGFNYAVGGKWPNKAWPEEKWLELEGRLVSKYKFSLQQGQTDIRKYVEWLNSCNLIVTNDSLGLHIALALKKKVVAIFGPTPHRDIYFYNRGIAVLPEGDFPCLPCLSPVCSHKSFCMKSISAKMVERAVENLFHQKEVK